MLTQSTSLSDPLAKQRALSARLNVDLGSPSRSLALLEELVGEQLQAKGKATPPWDCGANRPFATLAEATLGRLASIAPEETSGESVQPDLLGESMDHHVQSLNGKFELWAKQVRLFDDGVHRMTCRLVLIQGQKNEILNTWVFPTAPERCPVFAAELIAMAGSPRLTFIDLQSPGMQSGAEWVRTEALRLRADHSVLVCEEAPPEWAVSASEGGFVFSRSLPSSSFTSIDACYRAYFETYLDQFLSETDSSAAVDPDVRSLALKALTEYQVHHMENSPGSVFLGKLFGDEWTNNFLRNFLFQGA